MSHQLGERREKIHYSKTERKKSNKINEIINKIRERARSFQFMRFFKLRQLIKRDERKMRVAGVRGSFGRDGNLKASNYIFIQSRVWTRIPGIVAEIPAPRGSSGVAPEWKMAEGGIAVYCVIFDRSTVCDDGRAKLVRLAPSHSLMGFRCTFFFLPSL